MELTVEKLTATNEYLRVREVGEGERESFENFLN
jgi:hypothetical protein